MVEINAKNITDEFGSCRFIATLTPSTFTRKMIMVSTVWSRTSNSGETAIKQVSALNPVHIKNYDYDFTVLKTHKSLEGAFKYHIETTNSKGFIDCEVIE